MYPKIFLVAAYLLLASVPAARAEILDVTPSVRLEKTTPREDTTGAVVTYFSPPPRPSLDSAARISDALLRLEVPETVSVNRPFRVLLRAYTRAGLPAANFSAPVTFECQNGIIPVVSSGRWLNGLFEDTVVIVRAGKNSRLVAVAGGAIAMLHFDVQTPPPDKLFWLKMAEENLASNKIEDAIFCLKKASAFSPVGDPIIERRIGKIYMEREQWTQAEEHFRRAVRAISVSASSP